MKAREIRMVSRGYADTGSLLTHFICSALGLLSMKQMERNCIISRVERLLTGYLFNTQFVSVILSVDSIREAWPP